MAIVACNSMLCPIHLHRLEKIKVVDDAFAEVIIDGEFSACQSGHPLSLSGFSGGAYRQGWCCDRCRTSHAAGDIRWLCQRCETDICAECVPASALASAAQKSAATFLRTADRKYPALCSRLGLAPDWIRAGHILCSK